LFCLDFTVSILLKWKYSVKRAGVRPLFLACRIGRLLSRPFFLAYAHPLFLAWTPGLWISCCFCPLFLAWRHPIHPLFLALNNSDPLFLVLKRPLFLAWTMRGMGTPLIFGLKDSCFWSVHGHGGNRPLFEAWTMHRATLTFGFYLAFIMSAIRICFFPVFRLKRGRPFWQDIYIWLPISNLYDHSNLT